MLSANLLFACRAVKYRRPLPGPLMMNASCLVLGSNQFPYEFLEVTHTEYFGALNAKPAVG
jgi:hypothetical protein